MLPTLMLTNGYIQTGFHLQKYYSFAIPHNSNFLVAGVLNV
jgi:hypothetical protein